MTDRSGPFGSVPHGSLAEEACRLAEAAQQWLGERAGPAPGAEDVWADAVTSGSEDGATECRTCPICRARRLMSGMSPEVITHLSEAAAALGAAVKAMGGTGSTGSTGGTGT